MIFINVSESKPNSFGTIILSNDIKSIIMKSKENFSLMFWINLYIFKKLLNNWYTLDIKTYNHNLQHFFYFSIHLIINIGCAYVNKILLEWNIEHN